ncbi:hypothetical protein D1007_06795 [Hordeum vulgare]|nr:hypothetical protein D1007_06795 [Hordeum vulgare]
MPPAAPTPAPNDVLLLDRFPEQDGAYVVFTSKDEGKHAKRKAPARGRPHDARPGEEGKKRAVLLLVFAFGLAFLMSLTSSSVWINFPFGISLIVLFRYLSLDYDFHRKSTTATDHGTSRPLAKTKSIELRKPSPEKKSGSTGWRSKVNSPPFEAAFEQFTRHLVTEWVTDLWDLVDLVNYVQIMQSSPRRPLMCSSGA